MKQILKLPSMKEYENITEEVEKISLYVLQSRQGL